MKVLVQKNSDLTEEYKLPVGGEVIAVKNTEMNSNSNTNTNTHTGEHCMQRRVAEDHSGRVGRRPERHEDDCQVPTHLQVRPAQ